MTRARIRLASDATGAPRRAWAYVYPSTWHLAQAARRFNGTILETDCLAVTQAYQDDSGAITEPVIRLATTHLGLRVLSHEVSHAATAIYGSTGPVLEPLDHGNEPLAHLHSDLLADLVVGLRRHHLID